MRWRGRTSIRSLGARALVAFVLSLGALLVSVPVSTAQDVMALAYTLGSSQDFRLRVGAALSLGKSHSRAALGPLIKGLDDPQPAVRAAAAAALAVLGDRDALGALRTHLAREQSGSVRSQLRAAIESIDSWRSRNASGTKYLVKLGVMRNNSGVRGNELVETFRGVTRERAAALPGVVVLSDSPDQNEPAPKAPVLVLDGVVNRLAQGSEGARLTVSAQVEYVVRKAPEQSLKGSVSGTAQAFDSVSIANDRVRVARLENQALQGAVDSAMRGAPILLQQAVH